MSMTDKLKKLMGIESDADVAADTKRVGDAKTSMDKRIQDNTGARKQLGLDSTQMDDAEIKKHQRSK